MTRYKQAGKKKIRKKGEVLDDVFFLRLNGGDKKKWHLCAKMVGKSLGGWLRDIANSYVRMQSTILDRKDLLKDHGDLVVRGNIMDMIVPGLPSEQPPTYNRTEQKLEKEKTSDGERKRDDHAEDAGGDEAVQRAGRQPSDSPHGGREGDEGDARQPGHGDGAGGEAADRGHGPPDSDEGAGPDTEVDEYTWE